MVTRILIQNLQGETGKAIAVRAKGLNEERLLNPGQDVEISVDANSIVSLEERVAPIMPRVSPLPPEVPQRQLQPDRPQPTNDPPSHPRTDLTAEEVGAKPPEDNRFKEKPVVLGEVKPAKAPEAEKTSVAKPSATAPAGKPGPGVTAEESAVKR